MNGHHTFCFSYSQLFSFARCCERFHAACSYLFQQTCTCVGRKRLICRVHTYKAWNSNKESAFNVRQQCCIELALSQADKKRGSEDEVVIILYSVVYFVPYSITIYIMWYLYDKKPVLICYVELRLRKFVSYAFRSHTMLMIFTPAESVK